MGLLLWGRDTGTEGEVGLAEGGSLPRAAELGREVHRPESHPHTGYPLWADGRGGHRPRGVLLPSLLRLPWGYPPTGVLPRSARGWREWQRLLPRYDVGGRLLRCPILLLRTCPFLRQGHPVDVTSSCLDPLFGEVKAHCSMSQSRREPARPSPYVLSLPMAGTRQDVRRVCSALGGSPAESHEERLMCWGGGGASPRRRAHGRN